MALEKTLLCHFMRKQRTKRNLYCQNTDKHSDFEFALGSAEVNAEEPVTFALPCLANFGSFSRKSHALFFQNYKLFRFATEIEDQLLQSFQNPRLKDISYTSLSSVTRRKLNGQIFT